MAGSSRCACTSSRVPLGQTSVANHKQIFRIPLRRDGLPMLRRVIAEGSPVSDWLADDDDKRSRH
jgi:hypothetical protein